MSPLQLTLQCRYRYDPLDRLINLARTNTPAHQRFYCRSRLATEIQGAMQHSILQHGDLPLAQQQREGDDIRATLLATDLQRSVLQTLEKNHQRQSIVYSPYGHRRTENGLTSLLGFNGERADPVTGHYLLGNGYRAFNPVLMRFNSPDSLSPFAEGGLNTYAYCQGDPVNEKDPTGHAISFRWAPGRNIPQPRPIPRTGTNGTMLLEAASPLSRPLATVKPMQATSPALREPASRNVTNPHQRRTITDTDEFLRILEARQSPDAHTQMHPAMRVAMRNAVESPLTAVLLPTPIEDAARLIEMSVYAHMRGIGITSYPRATQLADQSRRMFEIRRRDQARMEAHPLLRDSPN